MSATPTVAANAPAEPAPEELTRDHEAAVEELLQGDFAQSFAAAEAAAPRSSFPKIPAGHYAVEVLTAKLFKKRPEDPRSYTLKWKFAITEGEFQGRYLWKEYPLQSDGGVKAFKQEMLLVRINTDADTGASDALDAVPHLPGVRFGIRLSYRQDQGEEYSQIYLNERGDDGMDIPAILAHIRDSARDSFKLPL